MTTGFGNVEVINDLGNISRMVRVTEVGSAKNGDQKENCRYEEAQLMESCCEVEQRNGVEDRV